MHTYAMIIKAKSENEAYSKAKEASLRYGESSVSSCINYKKDKEFFEETVKTMMNMYNGLKEANENMIKRVEGKVPEDDFILNQMKENLKRFNLGTYAFPEEWKVVYYDGYDFNHIDENKYWETVKKEVSEDDLYLTIIDTAK